MKYRLPNLRPKNSMIPSSEPPMPCHAMPCPVLRAHDEGPDVGRPEVGRLNPPHGQEVHVEREGIVEPETWGRSLTLRGRRFAWKNAASMHRKSWFNQQTCCFNASEIMV